MVNRIRRVISGALAAVLVLLMLPSVVLTAEATQSATGGFAKNYTLTGDGPSDMIAIALAQEGRTGAQIGYTEQWCADFVSDCAILAGQAEAVPQHGNVSGLYASVMNAGGTITTDDPQPGDLCFINWSGGTTMGHVEIVYDVSGTSLYTIGGNSGDGDSLYTRRVKKHAPLGSEFILSVVRPAYTNQMTDYLTSCTYFSSFAAVTTTEGAALWSIPCTDAVSADAVLVAEIAAGETFTATGMYLNTAGEYWYHVTYNDTDCYLYGGHVTGVTPLYSDLAISNVVVPSAVTEGRSFSIAGTITTEYNTITHVAGRVYDADTIWLSSMTDVNTKYFSLRSSAVDKGLKFGTLPRGNYFYKILVTVTNCITEDGKTLTYTSETQTMCETAFKVVSASDTEAPVISDVVVGDVTASGYTVTAAVTDNIEVEQVTFSTWTESNGQDDLIITTGTTNGSTYTSRVAASEHHDESGTYITEICAYDFNGNSTVYRVETAVPPAEGLTWKLDEGGTLTISGTGAMDNYANKTAMPWYDDMERITAVVIEEGVTSIGDFAFYGMPKLASVTIADTVTSIGAYAFKNSTALADVVLPAGLTKLGESAFYGCASLTAIDIPASLWTVQPYTFKNCTALAEVTFHEGNLMKISDSAFYNTALKSLVLPDCLDIVDVYAFKNCADLASVTLGTGLREIREATFYGTDVSAMEIPEGITKIGSYAFKNADKLTAVSLPDTLTSVGEAAFYACTALMTLELPDAVTTIGSYAFRKCTGLTDVVFGSGLTTIGESSFYGCTGITSLVIPAGVTEIQGYAFKACAGLTAVSLPDSLVTLGDSAFHSCTGLGEFTVPASVEAVGEYCLSGSTGIGTITFLGDAPAIGTGAFNRLTATARYPGSNATWTSDVMRSYGGTITWTAQ